MRKTDIVVGRYYYAKVSGQVVAVRIDGVNPAGGFVATNVATGRCIRIKTAARLRGPARVSGD